MTFSGGRNAAIRRAPVAVVAGDAGASTLAIEITGVLQGAQVLIVATGPGQVALEDTLLLLAEMLSAGVEVGAIVIRDAAGQGHRPIPGAAIVGSDEVLLAPGWVRATRCQQGQQNNDHHGMYQTHSTSFLGEFLRRRRTLGAKYMTGAMEWQREKTGDWGLTLWWGEVKIASNHVTYAPCATGALLRACNDGTMGRFFDCPWTGRRLCLHARTVVPGGPHGRGGL